MSIFGGGQQRPVPPVQLIQPEPPPPPPRPIDASLVGRGARATQSVTGFSSLVSTGPTGLQRKARGQQQSLVGTS